MDAVISGRAGKALLLDGDSLKSFDVDDPSILVSRRQADLPYLFGETQDLRVIENTDIESVQQELKHDCDCNWALDLALISLDAELPDEIRKEAIEGLDELLADSRVVERLENILYARPLPEDADLTGALNLCGETRFSNALALLQRFQERQQLIREISEAWDIIPTHLFGGYDQQAEFQHVAVREGLFRALVIMLESQRKASSLREVSIHLASARTNNRTSTFLLNAGLNDSIKKLRNYWQVLQHWASSFRQPSDAPEIEPEVEEGFDEEVSPRRRHGRRVGIDRVIVLKKVNEKKAVIREAMQRRNFKYVHEMVDDLVSYHLNNSEHKHTAKSLCDLAIEAKELGIYPLQLELTERSVNLAPDDNWSWIQYGDALLNMQRLDDALKAYQQAGAFGAGVMAKRGQAEVLKAEGRFEEALSTFNEIIAEYPEAIFAHNSRADLLMMLGNFNESLAAYNDILLRQPEDVVARNGRAEVLRAMGQLDEALTVYNDIIDGYPENIVARNNRDEVLAAKGQLYQTLVTLNDIIDEYPEDAVAEKGRVKVLKDMGRLDNTLVAYNGLSSTLAVSGRYNEALQFLPNKGPVILQDWSGYHLLGMILLRTGKESEAIQIFNEGAQNNPWPSSKQYFCNALAITSLKGGDFKEASQTLEEITSPVLQTAANILRIHAFGALGDRQRATAAYNRLATSPKFVSNELTQELYRRYISGEKPQHDEDWLFDQEIDLILLAA